MKRAWSTGGGRQCRDVLRRFGGSREPSDLLPHYAYDGSNPAGDDSCEPRAGARLFGRYRRARPPLLPIDRGQGRAIPDRQGHIRFSWNPKGSMRNPSIRMASLHLFRRRCNGSSWRPFRVLRLRACCVRPMRSNMIISIRARYAEPRAEEGRGAVLAGQISNTGYEEAAGQGIWPGISTALRAGEAGSCLDPAEA